MWYSVDIAIVGKSIRLHVCNMKVIANLRSESEFQVGFGFAGELSDEV